MGLMPPHPPSIATPRGLLTVGIAGYTTGNVWLGPAWVASGPPPVITTNINVKCDTRDVKTDGFRTRGGAWPCHPRLPQSDLPSDAIPSLSESSVLIPEWAGISMHPKSHGAEPDWRVVVEPSWDVIATELSTASNVFDHKFNTFIAWLQTGVAGFGGSGRGASGGAMRRCGPTRTTKQIILQYVYSIFI